MKALGDYRGAGRDLYERLHLSTYPVAIKYIRDISEIPEGAARPSLIGTQWSLCQAFTYARRLGGCAAMTSDDNFCTTSTAAQGWEDVSYEDIIESQAVQGWHRDLDAERKVLATARLGSGEHKGFVCAPLPDSPLVPDSVLIYGTAENITHIIHALAYDGENIPTSSFVGYWESCVKGALMPFVTGKPQVVIPGTGDRMLSGTYDYEIAIGLPANLVFNVVENLFATGGAMNMGQPVRTVFAQSLTEDITPGFRFMREKIEESKKKSMGS